MGTGVLPVLALLGAGQLLFVVFRWYRLLHLLGEELSFFSLLKDVLVGQMFNMFLPTSVGGGMVMPGSMSTQPLTRPSSLPGVGIDTNRPSV